MSHDVVLVHGFATDSNRTWRETGWTDLLADAGRNPIAIDLLGHGEAAKPHESADYAHLDDWLLERLPEGPVDAIGFSMGAQLLLTIAAKHPGRFERLVLLGIGDNVFDDGADPSTLIDAIRGDGATEDRVGDHFRALAHADGTDQEALLACLDRERTPLTVDLLGSVTTPVLVVLGDQDFIESAETLVETLVDVTLVTPRGLDHFATPKSLDCLTAALDFVDAGI